MPKKRKVQPPEVEIEPRTYARRLLLAHRGEISEAFRDQVWRLWNLLESMEYDTLRILEAEPIDQIDGMDPVTKIFSLRQHVANDLLGIRIIDWGEDEQLEKYSQVPGLTENQSSAVEVLRSVWRIRAFIVAADQLDQRDEGSKFTTARSLCERVALEMMMLAFASFSGDFKTKLKPRIENSLISEWRRLENLKAGDDSRQKKSDATKRKICEILSTLTRERTDTARAKSIRNLWPKKGWPWRKPSEEAIRKHLRILRTDPTSSHR
ncbi:MAG: hypothetical protein ACREQW_06415 [Candidatus Binatia bacterium]